MMKAELLFFIISFPFFEYKIFIEEFDKQNKALFKLSIELLILEKDFLLCE